MVFGRSEEEFDSSGELHLAQGGVGEVEEDTQNHRDGDQPEHSVRQGSQHWGEGDGRAKMITHSHLNLEP